MNDQQETLGAARNHLAETFGFEAFRPGQEAVVTALLGGRSALAVFPTGGGKSLCYQLPALLLDGLTLVVSPLIALMKDQVDVLRARGVAAARLDSSLDAGEARAVLRDLREGRLRLLYLAPERLANERFLARLAGLNIALLAVDEAHCISEWGHNFRPDYLKLARFARDQDVGRVLALTATATPEVSVDIRKAFEIAEADHVQTGFHRPNLELVVTPCESADRSERVLRRLESDSGSAIVYVTRQHEATDLATWLLEKGVAADAYHAGLASEARDAVQDAFMSGEVRTVVATIAFGMGIDKADIRTIIHASLPKTLEEYAQQVGRAGRDGLPGRCELLANLDDLASLQGFVHGDTPDPSALAELVHELLAQGEAFAVSRYHLSGRHDIRQLVVATALTYLELEGVLASTGPFYSTYKLRLSRSQDEVEADLDPAQASRLTEVLNVAKAGRTWLTLDLDDAAAAAGEPRSHIVALLAELESRGDATSKPSGLKHGYRLVTPPDNPEALVARLQELFENREARDLDRLQLVLGYARETGCLTQHLVGYFGEDLPGRVCGHCASCAAPGADPRAIPGGAPSIGGEAIAERVRSVREERKPALERPRALARFLCGIPSPATSKARLRGHPSFGALEGQDFLEVLRACEDRAGNPPGS